MLYTMLGFWGKSSVILPEENEAISLSFSEEQTDATLKAMKTDTALGRDSFPVSFFRHCWLFLKPLISDIINGFALGTIDISRINFSIQALIPKTPGAD